MSSYKLKLEMFGSHIGTICKTDKEYLYIPTLSVKYTKGKKVIWWKVRVPIQIVEDFDEYFKKIKN